MGLNFTEFFVACPGVKRGQSSSIGVLKLPCLWISFLGNLKAKIFIYVKLRLIIGIHLHRNNTKVSAERDPLGIGSLATK